MKKFMLTFAVAAMFFGGFMTFSGDQSFAARDLPNQHSFPGYF